MWCGVVPACTFRPLVSCNPCCYAAPPLQCAVPRTGIGVIGPSSGGAPASKPDSGAFKAGQGGPAMVSGATSTSAGRHGAAAGLEGPAGWMGYMDASRSAHVWSQGAGAELGAGCGRAEVLVKQTVSLGGQVLGGALASEFVPPPAFLPAASLAAMSTGEALQAHLCYSGQHLHAPDTVLCCAVLWVPPFRWCAQVPLRRPMPGHPWSARPTSLLRTPSTSHDRAATSEPPRP